MNGSIRKISMILLLTMGVGAYAAAPSDARASGASKPKLLPCPPGVGAAADPNAIARVVWIKGVLTAALHDKSRTLQRQGDIFLHDVLKTDDHSQAGIVFTDNTIVTLKQGTIYSIDTYNNKAGQGDNFIQTTTTGGLRVVTGLLAKSNPNNFKINTPVGSIGIRGTDFQFTLNNGRLTLGAFSGTPCVTNKPSEAGIVGTEICCNKNYPYAQIDNRNSAARLLNQLPPDLGPPLRIMHGMIPRAPSVPKSGIVTNFCVVN